MHIFLFFSFQHNDKNYSCALVQWYSHVSSEPDEDTGFWMVKLDTDNNGDPHLAIIHLDSIYWAVYLLPAHQDNMLIEHTITMHSSLDTFKLFYINNFMGACGCDLNLDCLSFPLSMTSKNPPPSTAAPMPEEHWTHNVDSPSDSGQLTPLDSYPIHTATWRWKMALRLWKDTLLLPQEACSFCLAKIFHPFFMLAFKDVTKQI